MTELAETEPTPRGLTEVVAAEPVPTVDTARSREWSGHPLNIRLSIPLLLGRYYFTIVAGRERRNPDRRESERRKHPLDTRRNLMAILVTGCVLGLALYGLQLTLGFWALEHFTVVD